MLTIRGTLQLNSLNPMKLSSDVLSQRLLGNYQMLGVSIQPQDLLHMTMLPPEIYVGQGEEQYAVINQNIKINNSTKIEMVNQFLNRILLLDTQEFTYQDEVYISNFLNKMGITNIQEFIDVTRKQLLQNEQITELLEKYTENEKNLFKLVEKKQEIEKKECETIIQQESLADIRYYLQNDIFNRLQTALLNKHIYENQKYISHNPKQITNQEFLLSEQMQLADKVHLTELKSKVFHDSYPCAYHHHYYYEQIPILEDQITEQSVLKYLGAAILNNMVNKMAYIRLQDKKDIWNQWISYQKAFYGSSENTIIRFEDMHMQQEQRFYNKDIYVESVNELYQNELAALNVFESQIEHKGEDYTLLQVINTLQQMQNHEKQAAEMIWLGSRIQILQDNRADIDVIEQLKKEDQILLENKLQLEQFIQQEQEFLYLEQLNLLKENYTEQYVEEQEQRVFELENNAIEKQWIENRKTIQKILKKEEQQIQFVDMADYRSYLEQVNERNIQMYQKLQQMELVKPTEKSIFIDRKSALKKTLEILEHPNKHLEEFLEEGTAILPGINQQIQQILSLTEEPVRELYEKILYHIEEKAKGKTTVRVSRDGNETSGQKMFLKSAMPFQLMETVKEIERLQHSTEESLSEQEEIPLIFEQVHDSIEQEKISEHETFVQREIRKEQKLQTEYENQTQIELEVQKSIQAVNKSEIQPVSVQEYIQSEISTIQDKQQIEIEERLEQISRNNTDIIHYVEDSVEKEEHIIVSEETRSEKEERKALKVQEYIQKNVALVQNERQKEIEEHLEQMNRSTTDVLHHVEEVIEKENDINVSTETRRAEEELTLVKEQERLQRELSFIQDKYQVEMEERLAQTRRSTTDILHHVEEVAGQEENINDSVEIKRREEIQPATVVEHLQKKISFVQDKQQLEIQERLEQMRRSTTDVLHHVEEFVKNEDAAVVSVVVKSMKEEKEQLSKETANILKKETQIMNQNVNQTQHTQQINLVHRNMEWHMEEQELNELFEKKKNIVDYQQTQTELTEHITVLEKRIQETKQEAIIQSKKSITELIQQNLQSQVNTISEQVYQKLEHRLWNERKRRGF